MNRQTDRSCLVLSYLLHVGGVNRVGDKSGLSATENVETVATRNEAKTTENSLDLSPILFTLPTRQDRQSSLVLSVV